MLVIIILTTPTVTVLMPECIYRKGLSKNKSRLANSVPVVMPATSKHAKAAQPTEVPTACGNRKQGKITRKTRK